METLTKCGHLVTVREAKTGDAALAAQIVAEAYKSCLKNLLSPGGVTPELSAELDTRIKPSAEDFDALIHDGGIYMILLNGATIGTFRQRISGGTISIDHFCVWPMFQYQGYGNCVLQMIEKTPGAAGIELKVPFFCIMSTQFDENSDYKKIGTHAGGIQIIYRKELA